MKVGDLVQVKWDDHVFDFGEQAAGPRAAERLTTVGFLVHHDKRVVRVALTRKADGSFAEVQTIDSRMLRWMRPLSFTSD